MDILITGVGGQGTILASKLLANTAIETGLFARTGETIGMSQRGGCVVSHVRIGSENKSSYIAKGGADVLIGFELAEAARNAGFLKKDGHAVINTQTIRPVTVSLGIQTYNEAEIVSYIRKQIKDPLFIDGYTLAEQAGSVKAVNVVLLGACAGAGYIDFSREMCLSCIGKHVPERFKALNEKAFALGYAAGKRE